MKVLMISKALVVGAYHGKLRELAARGVDMTLAIPDRWGSQKPEISESRDYRIVTMPCVLSGHNHFHFYRDMDRLFAANRYDLVHCDEEPYSAVTHQILRRTKRNRIPSLFFTWQNIEKKFPPPFNWIERNSFETASGALAGNREAEEVLRRKGFRKPIWVFPQFGVDPEVFVRSGGEHIRQSFALGSGFLVGYMGRLIPEKGLADVLVALAQLPPEIKLMIVGSGPEEARLRAASASLGVADRVIWKPFVPSSEVPVFMSAFDALVLPSHTAKGWKEQFGRVLVEAMSCGTPPIGSDSGEIPIVIGNAGLVVPEGQALKFRDAILTLFHDPGLRERLANKGRERVLQSFTHANLASQTVKAYEAAIESGCG